MPIPAVITDLNAVIASNSPAGGDPPGQGDDFLRAHAAFIRQNYDSLAAGDALIRSDLASSASAALGPALVGYSHALAYATNTVGKKLRERISVGDYGAVADGNYATGSGTDNTAAFQAAINAMSTSGGGVVYIPGGVLGVANSSYKLVSQITVPIGVSLVGSGKWSSIVFCPTAFANTGGLIRFNGLGGNPSSLSGVGVLAQVGGASGGYGVVVVSNGTFLRDVWVNGFVAGGVGIEMSSTDCFLDDFAIELCTTNLFITQTDVNISNGTVYQGTNGVVIANNAAVGSGRTHLTAVRATQNAQNGFALTAAKGVTMAGCSASADNNGTLMNSAILIDTAGDAVISGFSAKIGSTASTTSTGIKCINGSNDITISGSRASGFVDGFSTNGGTGVTITGCQFNANGRAGIYMLNGDQISAVGNRCYNNGTAAAGDAGIVSANGTASAVHVIVGNTCVEPGGGVQEYGIDASVTSTGTTLIVGNLCQFNNAADIRLTSTTGSIRCAQNSVGTLTDTAPSVASAAALTLPSGADFVSVTGTTNITSVTATGNARRQVTLVFAGALTFTDGSNLKLAGNFVTTADDTITLYCDGTNWFEIARSVN